MEKEAKKKLSLSFRPRDFGKNGKDFKFAFCQKCSDRSIPIQSVKYCGSLKHCGKKIDLKKKIEEQKQLFANSEQNGFYNYDKSLELALKNLVKVKGKKKPKKAIGKTKGKSSEKKPVLPQPYARMGDIICVCAEVGGVENGKESGKKFCPEHGSDFARKQFAKFMKIFDRSGIRLELKKGTKIPKCKSLTVPWTRWHEKFTIDQLKSRGKDVGIRTGKEIVYRRKKYFFYYFDLDHWHEDRDLTQLERETIEKMFLEKLFKDEIGFIRESGKDAKDAKLKGFVVLSEKPIDIKGLSIEINGKVVWIADFLGDKRQFVAPNGIDRIWYPNRHLFMIVRDKKHLLSILVRLKIRERGFKKQRGGGGKKQGGGGGEGQGGKKTAWRSTWKRKGTWVPWAQRKKQTPKSQAPPENQVPEKTNETNEVSDLNVRGSDTRNIQRSTPDIRGSGSDVQRDVRRTRWRKRTRWRTKRGSFCWNSIEAEALVFNGLDGKAFDWKYPNTTTVRKKVQILRAKEIRLKSNHHWRIPWIIYCSNGQYFIIDAYYSNQRKILEMINDPPFDIEIKRGQYYDFFSRIVY